MKNRSGLLTKVILVVFLILAFIMVLSVQMRLNELKAEKEELAEEVERYSDKVDELEYEIGRTLDDECLIEIARERLGYYQNGDTVFYYNAGE